MNLISFIIGILIINFFISKCQINTEKFNQNELLSIKKQYQKQNPIIFKTFFDNKVFIHFTPQKLVKELGNEILDIGKYNRCRNTSLSSEKIVGFHPIDYNKMKLREYIYMPYQKTNYMYQYKKELMNYKNDDHLTNYLKYHLLTNIKINMHKFWNQYTTGINNWKISLLYIRIAIPHWKYPFHFDCSNNMLFQLYGKKRIILFSRDLLNEDIIANIDEINSNPILKKIKNKMIEIILKPGDCLYIPPYMYHAVESIGNEICIGGNCVFNSDIKIEMNKVRKCENIWGKFYPIQNKKIQKDNKIEFYI